RSRPGWPAPLLRPRLASAERRPAPPAPRPPPSPAAAPVRPRPGRPPRTWAAPRPVPTPALRRPARPRVPWCRTCPGRRRAQLSRPANLAQVPGPARRLRYRDASIVGMELTITDAPEQSRYEARTDDGAIAGILMYKLADRLVVVTHTEVELEYE